MVRTKGRLGPNQGDVAREAGVSVSTVSRVLAGGRGISDDVRASVTDVASRLGYKARRHASGRSFERFIALIAYNGATSVLSHLYQVILESIMASASGLGVPIETRLCDVEDPLPRAMGEGLKPGMGVLFIGLDPTHEMLTDLKARGVPAVLVNGIDSFLSTDSVSPANFFGGRMIARYLIEAGHRKLLFIRGNDRWTLMRRAQGFEVGCDEFGGGEARIVSTLSLPVEDPDSSIRDIANWYRQEGKDATAIFCIRDTLAVYTYQALQSLGVSVPDDVSVIGFDDMPIATMMSPQLTSLHIEWKDLAHEAMTLLHRRLEHPDKPPIEVQVGGHMVVRDSVALTGAAAAKL